MKIRVLLVSQGRFACSKQFGICPGLRGRTHIRGFRQSPWLGWQALLCHARLSLLPAPTMPFTLSWYHFCNFRGSEVLHEDKSRVWQPRMTCLRPCEEEEFFSTSSLSGTQAVSLASETGSYLSCGISSSTNRFPHFKSRYIYIDFSEFLS